MIEVISNEEFPNENNEKNYQKGEQTSLDGAIMVNFGNNTQEELKEEDELIIERKRYYVSENVFKEAKDNHVKINLFNQSKKSDNYEAQETKDNHVEMKLFNSSKKEHNYEEQFSMSPLFLNTYVHQIKTENTKKAEKEELIEDKDYNKVEEGMIEEEDCSKVEEGMKEEYKMELDEETKNEEETKRIKKEKQKRNNQRKKTDRKFDPRDRHDLKRKRIKSNWYKHLIGNLNKKLKLAKIPRVFQKLPQCTVTNVSIEENHIMLNLTLREMLTKNFDYLHKKGKALKKNKSNYEHNMSVLNYLEDKNKMKIYNELNLGKILNMKMKEIYNEYLASDEFQKSIKNLINEKKQYAFIHYYIQIAKNFIEYYELKHKNNKKTV